MRPSHVLHPRSLLALCALAMAAGVCAGSYASAAPVERGDVTRSGGVTVEKLRVTVQLRRFDPRDPPPEMPPLGPHADAVTQSRFGCAASVQYTVINRRSEGRGRRDVRRACTATARIDSIHVTLDLAVTTWVPNRAGPKLAAHEEGHRVISERVYDEYAAAAARAAAMKLVGHTVTASGADCQAAADAAIKQANEDFCRAYLDATSGWSTRVGDRYDQLTSHGKRSNPPVEEAIRLAFEQEPQSQQEQSPREPSQREEEAAAGARRSDPPPARGPARIE